MKTAKNGADNHCKKICIVVTVAISLPFYRHQIQRLKDRGIHVTAIADAGPEHEELREIGADTVVIPMKRDPNVFSDIVSLARLFIFFLFNRFDLVCISTPKASLLASIAARLAFQPKVKFTIRGRVYENKTGLARKVFETLDKVICTLSDAVSCVSNEIMEDFVAKRLCSKKKIFVIGSGSGEGIDLEWFSKTPEFIEKGQEIRKSFGIGQDDVCILYSGRIRREKGTNELVKAFLKIQETNPSVHLLLQGKYEQEDPLEPDTIKTIESHPYIHQAGWCSEIQPYYAAADIFALPSYREGFPLVPLEAAAMKLPVVAFNVMGCREAVVHEKTGFLCDFGDVEKLTDALLKLINDKELRIAYGEFGRKRCEKEYDSEFFTNTLVNIYNTLIDDGIAGLARMPDCHFIK